MITFWTKTVPSSSETSRPLKINMLCSFKRSVPNSPVMWLISQKNGVLYSYFLWNLSETHILFLCLSLFLSNLASKYVDDIRHVSTNENTYTVHWKVRDTRMDYEMFKAPTASLNYTIIKSTYYIANGLPFNFLLGILLLLQLKNMFVEVELEIFISIIYTKLLKAVFLQKIT
jgi:hypothetical protein